MLVYLHALTAHTQKTNDHDLSMGKCHLCLAYIQKDTSGCAGCYAFNAVQLGHLAQQLNPTSTVDHQQPRRTGPPNHCHEWNLPVALFQESSDNITHDAASKYQSIIYMEQGNIAKVFLYCKTSTQSVRLMQKEHWGKGELATGCLVRGGFLRGALSWTQKWMTALFSLFQAEEEGCSWLFYVKKMQEKNKRGTLVWLFST